MAKNYVITSGEDCDGHFTPRVYAFNNQHEAERFAEDCNDGSDGILYRTADYVEAEEYADEWGLDMEEPDTMEDFYDPYDRDDEDNGYSPSEQRHADLSDYASQFSCPIQRAEIRAGA